MKYLYVLWITLGLGFQSSRSKVLELSDRFLPLRHDGIWLIKFYAPWCGHCKRLEPIWKHVEQALVHESIRVGRIDCTRFTNVATEFSIVGFPTILLLKGQNVFTYDGDQETDEIVFFALRLLRPSITHLTTRQDFEKAVSRSDISFIYSGVNEGKIYERFRKMANDYQQYEYFYSASIELMEEITNITEGPSIRVFKDDTFYKYKESSSSLELKMTEEKNEDEDKKEEQELKAIVSWLTKERFPNFIKVTRRKFNQLMKTQKLLVLAVLHENRLGELTSEMQEFKDLLNDVVKRNFDKYRHNFQFGWTGSPELANSVAMEHLSIPNLLVINTSSYQHHLPQDEPIKMTVEAIEMFLENILEGLAPTYGGSSFTVKLYRAFFESKSNLKEMWKGNPTLTALLFGLPFGFLSLICYSICCSDILDAEEEDDEDEIHEKVD